MKLLPILAIEDPGVAKEMRVPMATMATKEQNTSFVWVRRHRPKLAMSGSSFQVEFMPILAIEDPGVVYEWRIPLLSRKKHPYYGFLTSYDAAKGDHLTRLKLRCTRLMSIVRIPRVP